VAISKEDLVAKLRQLRPNRQGSAYRAVASDLYYSGEFVAAGQLDDEGELLDRMFLAYSNKSKPSNKITAEDPASCPLCKLRLTPVKLDSERKAVWCSRHFVVYPYKD
jgi:hypothetical protein